jgi:hypothetical protein
MKMSEREDWDDKDAIWELLGKAAPKKASGCFADDTLRTVKLLPETDPWWPKSLSFLPWIALAACAALAAFLFLNPSAYGIYGSPPIVNVTVEADKWVEIEAVAAEEMLAAAADHLERFSDQELVTLVGF